MSPAASKRSSKNDFEARSKTLGFETHRIEDVRNLARHAFDVAPHLAVEIRDVAFANESALVPIAQAAFAEADVVTLVFEHEVEKFRDLVGVLAQIFAAHLEEADREPLDHDVVADERADVVLTLEPFRDRGAEFREARRDELRELRFAEPELVELRAEMVQVRHLFAGLHEQVAARGGIGREGGEFRGAGVRDFFARDEMRERALEELGRGRHQLEGRQRLHEIDAGGVVDGKDQLHQPGIAKSRIDDELDQPVFESQTLLPR